ncbi:MAG TPA: hypothetical protein VNA88_03280, partial [Candidatus Kapabacteria bacterium]|nr:hypothetical protein [Candidatus Kapabacteria bacterium]
EIIDAGRRLVAALGPQAVARAVGFMLPAMDAVDRLEYVRTVTAALPPAAATSLMGLAETSLTAAEFERLASELGWIAA